MCLILTSTAFEIPCGSVTFTHRFVFQVNSQEREIEALRKERDIMLSDTSMEEKLRQALEERDQALQRENQMKSQYETAQKDMQKLNNQLISAVQQKLELSEQLEQWQVKEKTSEKI